MITPQVCIQEPRLHTPKRGDRVQDFGTSSCHPTMTAKTCDGLRMLFDAHQDADPFRVHHALSHLDFLTELERVSGIAR